MTASGIVDTVYDIFTEKVSYSRFSYVWRFWRNSPMNCWHSLRYIYGKRVILRLFTPFIHELLTQLAIYLRKKGHTPAFHTNFAWIIDTFGDIFTETGSYSGLSNQFCMNYWHIWLHIYGKRVILRLFTPIWMKNNWQYCRTGKLPKFCACHNFEDTFLPFNAVYTSQIYYKCIPHSLISLNTDWNVSTIIK